ncbi:MAG: nucleoside triphosphate pyrophosphohydrolase [Anaerovoracaceae bacterium]|nr:nucleoside triphosphate pyrophosphohydrolase [Anaerovoracaceae bacterium]
MSTEKETLDNATVNEKEKLSKESITEEEAFSRLRDIVRVLRKECPWDKAQTHQSLKSCLLEEAYEVVDAINNNDDENLEEELGDLLLQVIFHGVLAEEANSFDLLGVINRECEKMIRRHPHVFFKEKIDTIDKVLDKWENVKRKERGNSSHTERLMEVPKALPALLRSYKLQAKAAQAGFDWEEVAAAFLKLEEELLELKVAMSQDDQDAMTEELGDLLFSVVNVARFLKVNPEEALNSTSVKFIRRFSEIERKAEASGKYLEEMSLEEMDKLWEGAKLLEDIK